jgi:hypothetical protein
MDAFQAKKAGGMMNKIFQAYVYRNLYRDVRRFVRRNLRNVQFDREYWLQRAGLTQHRPMRRTLGGVGLMLLGGIGGAVTALVLAPKPGAELRHEVRDRARRLMERQGMPKPISGPEEGVRA